MHYVYPKTNQPVPSSIEVSKVPPGISEKYPLGGFFTSDGVQVTGIKDENDGVGIAQPQDHKSFTKVDLMPDLRGQLARMEQKLDSALKALNV